MTKELRARAAEARRRADVAFDTSEYPRSGRAAWNEHAQALDALADTLDEIGEPPERDATNHRESRRRARIYWLTRKAAEKEVEGTLLRCESHAIAERRPFGQPIIVGHHSEGGHRSDLRRQHSKDRRAMGAHDEAEDLRRKAQAAASNRSIYGDDPEALTKLQAKLGSLLRAQEAAKPPKAPPILNYRAPEGLPIRNQYHTDEVDTVPQVEMTKAEWKKLLPESRGTRVPASCGHRVRYACGFWKGERQRAVVFLTDSKAHPKPEPGSEPKPRSVAPSYARANLSKQIADVRRRIAEMEAREAHKERPARNIGGIVIGDNLQYHKVELHFPDKPSDEVRTWLKAHGFRWVRSVGCWSRGINSTTEGHLQALAKMLGEAVTC